MQRAAKPIVAVTMGDPAGIGPEVIVKALADPAIKRVCRPLILGDWGVLDRASRYGKNRLRLIPLRQGEPLLPKLNRGAGFVVCPLSSLKAADSRPGVASRAAGHATFRYIQVAAKLALMGLADAIATAPISKHILIDAGYNYPGHTELLAELSRTRECRMMLVGRQLRVVPVTGHIPFSRVSRALTVQNIQTTIELTHGCLKEFFGIRRPRIAVAALNPHGGETGIFGNEEIETIQPAVKAAYAADIDVRGPFAADSLFHHAARGDYDAVICMYHDQGLIPLKLHHFFGGVALTLGPPFIRTSVDHGTAYDIAGKGKADATSMKEAILLAARLARLRKHTAGKAEQK
ncbi:MAG TPA: 4-hydroxythreonine-4-phosphate dehydrogenase PdxA [Candidatus Binatia bacterium]|nr:4-hydroxythreonine-4-phosphate dehydrogenase PdxA [Candidatus Binatia bacterium]